MNDEYWDENDIDESELDERDEREDQDIDFEAELCDVCEMEADSWCDVCGLCFDCCNCALDCTACGCTNYPMGYLGKLAHYRCRNCGWMYTGDVHND